MREDIATKWADALESGKYDQAQGVLTTCDGTSFCCLGVLAKENKELIEAETNFKVFPVGAEGAIMWKDENDDGFEFMLPDGLGKFLQLSPEEQGMFAKLNDDNGLNFYQIAQVIRNVFVEA